MPGPILRIEGRDRNQDPGVTLRDIRLTYPGCYLVNGDNEHRADAFVLQDNTIYELIKAPQPAGKDCFPMMNVVLRNHEKMTNFLSSVILLIAPSNHSGLTSQPQGKCSHRS